MLAGKALALFTYVLVALVAVMVIGALIGIVAWGFHSLVDLSGARVSAGRALAFTVVALAVYGLPVLAIASFGLFLSVVTRHGVGAFAGTLLYALALQGLAGLSAIAPLHPYLLVDQLAAWHDLFQTPIADDAIVRALWVSAAFAAPPLLAAWIVFRRRDVTT